MTSSWLLFLGTAATIFLMEMGDKTQLAILVATAKQGHPLAIFLGASLALVASSGLAVVTGRVAAQLIEPRWMHYGAAILFIVVGLVMLVRSPETPSFR